MMMQAIAESGAECGAHRRFKCHLSWTRSWCSVRELQKQRILPADRRGQERPASRLRNRTRPQHHGDYHAGRAVRRGYLVNGAKIWTSTAQISSKMLLLARTTPLDQVKRCTQGLTLFYTDARSSACRGAADPQDGPPCGGFEHGLHRDHVVPEEDRIGAEGEGFHIFLHGLNPERVLVAAEAIGIGRAAIARASRYARERIVFDRPIGMNQGIAHPLAKCWAQLEAANLMVMKAAGLYDEGQPCGAEANAGKYLAARRPSMPVCTR